MQRCARFLAAGWFLFFAVALYGGDIHVTAGESIQKAIDAAQPGATIKIDAGVFTEHLTITKPLTLVGAGWEKTLLRPIAATANHTDADKIAFANRVESARNLQKAMDELYIYLGRQVAPTISINGVEGVTLRGLKIQGIAPGKFPGSGSESLIALDHAGVKLLNCAAVGPSNDGIEIANDSNVDMRHCLVAGVWRTGVAVYAGRGAGQPSTVHLADCDIRNCYYAGVTLRGDGSTVDHCRISGSAWHGIRYDDCSPEITNNLIYGIARSGIYASGNTHATIRNNIFWKNEMDAVSCWFDNQDTIQNNTIVGNLRAGLAVLGASKPLISHNVLADNPVAIDCSAIGGEGPAVGSPTLQSNWLWNNESALRRGGKPEPAPPGMTSADPDFVDADKHDYSLNPDSPARQAGMGASVIISVTDPWPLTPEEQAMIPKTDTRDYQDWKKPPAIQ